MRRRFVTLDVFTGRRFAGNALAVVLDADGLDGAAMQAIAREFNLSETVFVSPPDDPAHQARLRIFTPALEMPFAGHPTVGTAVLLGRLDGNERRELVLEEGIGPVRCAFEPRGRDTGHARFDLPRLPEQAGVSADAAALAAALGLDADEIGGGLVPEKWSAGNPFTFVPVRNLASVRASRPDPAHWERAFGGGAFAAAFVFCRETEDAAHAFHARMFAPGAGVPEDPATGSAVAAFAGFVTRQGGLADGRHELRIEQGYEMGRPSLIELHMVLASGRLAEAAIGGEAVIVAEGTIEA